ncbi:MAG: tetratricopeptide repeat protein [Lentisphaerae bacterium]|nr:tetratricopeptide repeat protein [Lentisphaerota bacterium]MBT5607362.1 tetratricopeptide repeat protein [Lentisphaerota bacterium]MBT7058372.1 tetratricopeptide repeat protein [Lentisphaerota bacterium]MBT7841689.1 tetratricopeptide repeat protein [Lentisphaerota bacterium]
MFGELSNRIGLWLQRSASWRQREATVVSGVLLLGVVVRGWYLWQYSSHHLCHVAVGPDVQEYDLWARQILGGELLWRDLHIHAPLYAYFLAALYWVTGQALVCVRGVQLVVDLVSLALAYATCRRLWGRRTAAATGVLWALYAPFIYYSGELFSETLVVLFITAALLLWASLSRWRGGGVRRHAALLALGICLGLSCICHPLMVLSAGGVVACTAARYWRSAGRFHAVLASVLVLAGIAMPVFPVALRNWVVSRELVPIQARSGMNVYIGNNSAANGTCYLRPGVEYDALVDWPEREGIEGEGASSRFYRSKAAEFVREHPFRWAGLVGRKLLLTWNATEIPSGPDLPEIRTQTAFMRGAWLRFGVICPLALVGALTCRRGWGVAPLWCVPGVHTLALGLLVTSGRYRLGMMPAVLMMAGAGISTIVKAWQRDDRELCKKTVLAVLAGCTLAFVPRPPPLVSNPGEAASLLAQAAWRNGDRTEAEVQVERALSLEPANAGLYHLHGVLLAEEGRFGEAIVCYETALAYRPGLISARIDRAVALSELGRKAAAAKQLHTVLKESPMQGKAWYNLGVIQESSGQPGDALLSYDRAIHASPALSSAHLNRGVLLHRQGRSQDALRSYQTALRLQPQNARAWSCVALAHIDSGNARKACAAFRRALRLVPAQPEVWLTYARYVAESGDAMRVAAILRAGRKANPTHSGLLNATPSELMAPESTDGGG